MIQRSGRSRRATPAGVHCVLRKTRCGPGSNPGIPITACSVFTKKCRGRKSCLWATRLWKRSRMRVASLTSARKIEKNINTQERVVVVMKITIDTANDSPENIRKAIRLLQALVEHDAAQGSRNLFDSPGADLFGSAPAQQPAPQEGNPLAAFGRIFGDDAPAPQQPRQEGDGLPRERPQIELY
jgi:hypothetical protein